MAQERILLDRTGFPLLWVESIGAYLHLFPVTKVQLELFLCDARDGHFNRRWYEEVLKLNPRTTARRLWRDNYWQAFATGILPSEAERFAAWCGEEYRLPTESEWTKAYAELRLRPAAELLAIGDRGRLGERARELVERLALSLREAASAGGFTAGAETLAAMRLGILEWVGLEGDAPGRWGALGEPNPAFYGNLLTPDKGGLVQAAAAETARHPAFGFRLVLKPTAASLAA